MKFVFHLQELDFFSLKHEAVFLSQQTGVLDPYVSLVDPIAELKKAFGKSATKISLKELSEDLGQKVFEYGNGAWVATDSDANWSLVANLQEVQDNAYWQLSFECKDSLLQAPEPVFLELVERLSPDLAFGFPQEHQPYDIAYFMNSLGPWAGLRDVYQYNYWGKDYSELVGKGEWCANEYIKRCDDFHEGMYFSVDPSFLAHRSSIKEDIGTQYFIDRKLSGGANQQVGLFALFKTLCSLSKKDEMEELTAAKHPVPKLRRLGSGTNTINPANK